MSFNPSSKNSKTQLKIPPNNINININFNVKDNKQLVGKKIDNLVHVSRNSNQPLKRTTIITDGLKQKKKISEDQSREQTELLKTKRLDNMDLNKFKKKERSAKTSRPTNQYISSTFSTNKLKNKNYSKQLKDIFNKNKKNDQNVGPTPIKPIPFKQEKTKKKSNQKAKRSRVMSNQKPKPMKKTAISLSVQNLRRAKHVLQGTPSKSSRSKSHSKNSSKAKKLHVILNDKQQVQTRRGQLGLQFLNQMQEGDIKNILKKSRKKSNKKMQAAKTGEPPKLSEEQTIQIRAYMQQKKKRIQKQKQKKEQEQKQRLQKLREQLSKVQIQRKQTIRQTNVIKKKLQKKKQRSRSSKNTIMSNKNNERQYEQLKQQALKLLNFNNDEKNDTSSHKQHPNNNSSNNSKKKKKIFTNKLLQNYYNENITQRDYEKLENAALTIQKLWRGYKTRKQTLMNLQKIENKVYRIQKNIQNKQVQFWGNNSNSILQLQNEIIQSDSSKTMNVYEQKIEPDDSWEAGHNNEQQKHISNDDESLLQQQKSEQEFEQGNLSKVMRMIQALQKESKNNKLSKQIKYLKQTMLKQQQQKNKILKQNKQLKQNMKQLIKQQANSNSKQIKKLPISQQKYDTPSKKQQISQEVDQQQFIIRMPVKITQQNQKPKNIQKQIIKQDKKIIDDHQKQQRRKQIQLLKKFKQQSDNMIKKNKKNLFIQCNQATKTNIKQPIQQILPKLTSPKYQQPNLMELLKQKQRILDDKHKKSQQVIRNMYHNKLVSPRSFNYKLNQLQKIIQKQRKSIKRSLKQAQKITNLIKGIQKDKEQIKGLQRMSKQQRWNDAINIIDDFSGLGSDTQQKQEQNVEQDTLNNFKRSVQQQQKRQKKITIMTIFDNTNEQLKQQTIKRVQNEIDQMNDDILNYLVQDSNERHIKKQKPLQKEKQQLEIRRQIISQQKQVSLQNDQQQKPGFQTNLNFVKQYCIGLCQYIRSKPNYKQQFKQNIVTPITFNLPQFLKCYRQTLNNQYSYQYNSFKKDLIYPYFKILYPPNYTISEQIFIQFNQNFSKLKRHSKNATLGTIQLQTYHLKSLLGAFNQALDYERPSGIYGKPLPWSSKSKHLKNINSKFQQDQQFGIQYTKQDQKFDQIFGVAIARVIQWGSSLCGFIPQSLQLERGQVLQIDQEYVNHIKQTRMALMLQKNLAEQQQKMLEFSEQQTQVKLEAAQKILQKLIKQFQEEFRGFTRQNDTQQSYFQYLE